MNIPYVDNSESGLEDVAFYVKHRFLEKERWPSLGYLVTATLASSTEEFSTDGSIGGGFVISQRVGPVQGHVNLLLFHPWDSDLDDEFQFLAGVEGTVSPMANTSLLPSGRASALITNRRNGDS
jgi:hypothetical protein